MSSQQNAPQNTVPDVPGHESVRPLLQGRAGRQHSDEHKLFAAQHSESEESRVVKLVSKQELAAYQAYLDASISHPNLLDIIDLGDSGQQGYVVMPLCPRGDLSHQLASGMHIQALAKALKDVARAMDIMHHAGLVHCDIKAENVLFDASGMAQLSDFGNCRKIGASCKNAAGLVSGTPAYMSPEQAAGREVDARADYYSLGILLYYALAGELPYKADSAVELGIKHLQDPIPRLPNYLAGFQGLVDGLLAKRRDQRLHDLDEVIAMINVARESLTNVQTTIKTQEITTQEIRIAGGDMLATPRDPARIERLSRRRRRRRVLRVVSASLLLVVVLGGSLLLVSRSDLIDPAQLLSYIGIGEDPALRDAWDEAQSIHADSNQGLATIVAAYRRVLALDQSHPGAQAAIASLNNEWMQSIDAALDEGNLEAAQSRLQDASAVFPDDMGWVQLSNRLQNYQRAQRIAESTRSLLTSHGLSDLPSATAAIQAYQEVLRLAPGHPYAQTALSELALHYANLSIQAATVGEVNDAISLLERATAADATLPILDEARSLISQATTTQQAIDELLQQARRYRSDDQLITPAGENAAELYHRVLATDTNNVVARQGLDEVRAQVTANVEQLLVANDLDAVEEVVVQAGTAGMASDFINELRGRLDDAQAKAKDIRNYLVQANELIAQGLLTAPPENNAVAKLRMVQQLDPGNTQAAAQLSDISERLVEVAMEAHQWEMYEQAKQYLDLALTINPEVSDWVALRESWESDPGTTNSVVADPETAANRNADQTPEEPVQKDVTDE